jgi:hypothetical protein
MSCIRHRKNQSSWSDLTFVCSNLLLLACIEDQTVPSSRSRPEACLYDERALTVNEATWRTGSTHFCPPQTIFPIREVLARDFAIVKAASHSCLRPQQSSAAEAPPRYPLPTFATFTSWQTLFNLHFGWVSLPDLGLSLIVGKFGNSTLSEKTVRQVFQG